MKTRLLLLACLLLAAPAQAAHLFATATVTKIAESTYDVDYFTNVYDVPLPAPYQDPYHGYTYYFVSGQEGFSGISGAFGLPQGEFSCNLDSYGGLGLSGSFRIFQDPSTPWSAFGDADIIRVDEFSDWIVGAAQANVTIFGSTPTLIGERTQWNPVPEPTVLLLLPLGLLLAFRKPYGTRAGCPRRV